MTAAARERLHVWAPMLFVSAAAWIVLAIQPSEVSMHSHGSAATHPASLATGWLLMLAAMMAPALIAPVQHVRDRSFARRRVRALALFVGGYVAIWMLAGAILLALAQTIRVSADESLVPLALVTIVAIVWQFSPVKQRCLNRCHAHTELAAFGIEADRDALRFGLAHGIWCVGSCWALMMLPLFVSRGHVAAMAAVTLLIFAERFDRPMPPKWSWRGPTKAARIAIAQTQLRLQRS